ncbi:hypothetical protein K2173_017094 [Erythroxylum novogranatense]|uniref:Uncharacterized protein n=1 Tax=Erythroxylum novogranatense TaxID=1862640 RepID=A0AAV8U9Y9_9ROSI|nr:hypothetical protein K2173_017094 [Erythroxylum novogranatense]
MAGRVTLCQLVLGTIPLYTMQTAKIPKGLIQEMDRYCKRFILGEFRDFLPNNLIMKIVAIFPPQPSQEVDQLYWSPEPSVHHIGEIHSYVQDVILAQRLQGDVSPHRAQRSQILEVCWQRLSEGWVNLSTNDSFKGNPILVIADGLLRMLEGFG